jgi:hypothetical protein
MPSLVLLQWLEDRRRCSSPLRGWPGVGLELAIAMAIAMAIAKKKRPKTKEKRKRGMKGVGVDPRNLEIRIENFDVNKKEERRPAQRPKTRHTDTSSKHDRASICINQGQGIQASKSERSLLLLYVITVVVLGVVYKSIQFSIVSIFNSKRASWL